MIYKSRVYLYTFNSCTLQLKSNCSLKLIISLKLATFRHQFRELISKPSRCNV